MLLWEYLDDRCWIAAEYSIKFKYFFVTNAHRIIKGEQLLKNYLNDINVDAKTKVMKKQIDIVGGCQHIYEIVNKNLKKGLIEFSLLKETCDLYSWRKSYFNKNLSVKQGAWFTNSYYINTMTYQITKNFDQVVNICCSNLYLNKNGNHPRGIYLKVEEKEITHARNRIEHFVDLFNTKSTFFWKFFHLKNLSNSSLRYGDVAKILFEHHQNSPHRLEEIALRKVKKDGFYLENISEQVKRNDEYGFFDFESENYLNDLKNFSQDGQDLFKQLKLEHNLIREKRTNS